MGRVFDVYIGHQKYTDGEIYATLSLPATPHEIIDAYEKLRLREGEAERVVFDEFHKADFLEELLPDNITLLQLNALAEKIAGMNDYELAAFEGLVTMEADKHEYGIPFNELYDFAASTDCCNVAFGVTSDYKLGKFYVDNGFIPEYDYLPESVYDDLDYAKIGREMRVDEHGAFIDSGYVVKSGEITEAHKDLRLELSKPEYTVLIEVSVMDFDKTVMLGLPTTEYWGNDAVRQIGADNWDEINIRCADCRVPQLRDAITQENTIFAANTAAITLEEMADKETVTFKAVLEARGFADLDDALGLANNLGDYICSRQFSSLGDVALEEIMNLTSEGDAELLLEYVDLYQYGKALIESGNIALTAYGGIERQDGEPIVRMEEPNHGIGGMEM